MPKHPNQSSSRLTAIASKWLKDPRKFSHVQLLVFALVFALIGGYLIFRTFAATPSIANLWVDTSAGTCGRQASAAAYNDSQACASIDAAWDNCQPGDVIVIKAGTYGAQTISGNKTSPGCSVIGESNVTIGALATNGAYLTLENVTVDAGPSHASGGWNAGASNVTLKDVRFHGPYVSLQISGVSNVRWLGGELGEAGKVGGKRIVGCTSTGDAEPVQLSSVSNIIFDGIDFYPQDKDETPVSCSSNGFHLEMIRMDGGTTFTTIKNSTFHNGDHSNTSSIFITTPSAGSNIPHDLTFANNFFGTAENPTFNSHTNVNVCQNITIAYNTMLNGTGAWQCASASNMLWVGNIGAMPSYEDCLGTHIKNVWQDDRTFTCGSDKVVVGTRFGEEKLGLGGTEGFYIQSGSPGIDAGETTYCSSLLGNKDHDGGTRPNGSVCDAGAIEYGTSPAPPPTPAPPPPPPPPSSGGGNTQGDVNGDGKVDITDLSILLTNYNTTSSTADINNDGSVNIFDLSILLSNYGSSSSGGTANIWLSASGNDSTCVRGDSSKPCLTINKARGIAQCGDTVTVAGGSYGSQSVSSGTSCSTNPVIFKVASGTANFGSITLSVAGIRLDGITTTGRLNLNSSCNGCQVYNSTLPAFSSEGADKVEFVGNNIGPTTSSCTYGNNFLWSATDTDGSSNWLIQGNTFHDFQCDEPHSEALYIANRAGPGLIENNTFRNNGNTSHIFWTWCNDQGNGCVAYGQNNGSPHDWCTRNNTFYDTWDAYYAINIREELELSGNPNHLYIDNHQTVTGPVIPPSPNGQLAGFIVDWGKFMLVSSCNDPRT